MSLSPLQQLELKALVLDRPSVISCVSALRRYRAAVRDLLAKRYADGEVDGATLSAFSSVVDEVEACDG
jgi:hypothetical protein